MIGVDLSSADLDGTNWNWTDNGAIAVSDCTQSSRARADGRL